MKRRSVLLSILVCAAVLCCVACAGEQRISLQTEELALPTATPAVTPVPTPAPTPVPPPEAVAVTNAFWEMLASMPQEYDMIGAVESLSLPKTPSFSDVRKHRDDWIALAEAWRAELHNACDTAFMQLEDRFPDFSFSCAAEVLPLDWKYAGSLLWTKEDECSPWEFYQAACSVDVSDKGDIRLAVSVTPKPFQKVLSAIAGEDRELYMSARFLMSYLTTVFDENGEETEYVMPELPEGYTDTWHDPLEKSTFWDSWYRGRSRNTRKHTGLDMRAPRNAPILSCTDGTILCIGYGNVSGYYVVILDDLGYEFHYYHMVRETAFLKEGQRVQAGDLIGHVGNTGNSEVNHLHLAVITPDSRYVKLYEIMRPRYYR